MYADRGRDGSDDGRDGGVVCYLSPGKDSRRHVHIVVSVQDDAVNRTREPHRLTAARREVDTGGRRGEILRGTQCDAKSLEKLRGHASSIT